MKPEDLRASLENLSGPDWLRAQRLEALEKSGYPALPDQENESWRKIKFGGLDLKSFSPLESKTSLQTGAAVSGTHVASIADAVAADSSDADLIRELNGTRLNELKNSVFSYSALALEQKGVFIRADAPVAEPVVVRHSLEDGDSLFHRTLIHVRSGAELTVIEEFNGSPGDSSRLWNHLADARVEANGSLNYIALLNFSASDYNFRHCNIDLMRDARARLSVVCVGGKLGKSFYTSRLREPGAWYRGIGIGSGSGREFNDMEMFVGHQADHTESSLLYKTVLAGRAHSIFNGNLEIDRGVKHADSHQINNNVLLSKTARAESMPNLVIHSEDVSCEHGATVGELDEEALFFLQARGIPESEARDLLIEGFIRSLAEEIPVAEERREEIFTAVKNKISP